ncbi:MAG: site-specific DNA-methyltransferase [Muribaculaceae bacterium]|nr:site-specific DNA-methyltransferase [Muribaculaceae bacterium]
MHTSWDVCILRQAWDIALHRSLLWVYSYDPGLRTDGQDSHVLHINPAPCKGMAGANNHSCMNNLQLFRELEQLLQSDDRLVTADGRLLKNRVVELALRLDGGLLRLLLGHEGLRRCFFADVDGTAVFDKVKFQRFVLNKQFLPDSYTAYKNRIGLTDDEGRFISQSREVVLAWPYKDCMLEGGQTTEEAKRDEVFWNETLAPDEISRLTEPKALTAFSRYDSNGAHPVEHLTATDNLLIKGNNLLALYCLRERFRGKVKLIYIDPPYYFNKTKPSDTFSYNSNFRLSTWLTFMRDRLLVANDLLRNDGVLLCHIKEDGVHWLKVLMEEIFGVDNFVETFIWKNTDNPDSLSNKSRSSVEYIICFEKKKDYSIAYKGKETENGDAPILHTGNNIHELVFPPQSIRFNIPDGEYKCGKPDRVEILTPIIVSKGRNTGVVRLKGEFTWSQETLDANWALGCYFLVKSKKFSVRVQLPSGKHMAPEKFIDNQYLSKAIHVGTNEDASSHLKNMGINFSFSKPESVVAFFIQAVTNEDDWVLDFFVGSGTTAAAALKMGRRFIAVDQMDYIQTATIPRLCQVIAGERGGISEAVGWKGGGSFVHCELAKANERFVEAIMAARDGETLQSVWQQMQQTGFLSYKVSPKDIDAHADDWNQLTLDDQRRFLIECLDKNLLYVPLRDIESAEFAIEADDRRLTHEFYAKTEKP